MTKIDDQNTLLQNAEILEYGSQIESREYTDSIEQ
jgi:hypothetical protein